LERLASLKVGKTPKGSSLPEVLRGLRAYGERHFGRVADLCDESFLLEFTLREMDGLGTIDEETNGFTANSDVVMV
jgi:U3 small nucleolar RNA-associated protein 13